MSEWVDIYHPDFWDAEEMGDEQPEPGNPLHDGRWSRVTRESYDLNWSKRGWVTLGEQAPPPEGSLQGGETTVAATSDEEDSTSKSSSSRKTAK